jgi:hypothetical protein
MTSIAHSWGTRTEERGLAFPCDHLIADADDAMYRGITIRADREVVFRWLCQMRVAPYSYDWLDNLGRRSPRQLTAGLDALAVGQTVMRDFEIVDFAWGEHLTLGVKSDSLIREICPEAAVSYCTLLEQNGDCRLLVKVVVTYQRGSAGWLARRLMPWGDLVMMRRQLLNFKQLAERTCELRADRMHWLSQS